MSTFSYVKYDQAATEQQALFKTAFEQLEKLASTLEPGRPAALVLTKLEEAYMWVGKSIRDRQIKRNGGFVDEQPERSND